MVTSTQFRMRQLAFGVAILLLTLLTSCGAGSGLGVAALLGAASGMGADGSGMTGVAGSGSYADASLASDAEDDDALDGADAESSPVTYYTDENGNVIAVDELGTSYDAEEAAATLSGYADASYDGEQGDFDAADTGVQDADGAEPVDASVTDATAPSSGAAEGSSMTDEESEYGSTELGDIALENLPVTIAKEDGDSGDDDGGDGEESEADCSAQNGDAVMFVYAASSEESSDASARESADEASRSRHARKRSMSGYGGAGISGTKDGPMATLAQAVMALTANDAVLPLSAEGIAGLYQEQKVFFIDKLAFHTAAGQDDGAVDVDAESCPDTPDIGLIPGGKGLDGVPGEDQGADGALDTRTEPAAEMQSSHARSSQESYAWEAMTGAALSRYEVEIGAVRIPSAGKVSLSDKATVLQFSGDASSTMTLRAADFGLTGIAIKDADWVPYLILRPKAGAL